MRLPEAIGTREILIGVGVLLLLLLAAIPLLGYVRDKSKRAEVPLLVESIRAAELSQGKHFAAEGYVSADWAPRPPTALDANAVPWEPSEGFTRLGWSPAQEGYDRVYGTYKVAATEDGFTVTGKCDLDGDGVPAWYEATAEETAHEVRNPGAY
jgi:hypothetical protein